MAVFHFEIKSDRRKGGKQTSALQHVKYINREGPYQDADERELIKMPAENVITGPELHEHAPGRELLLYSSPFGVIKQDDSGIHANCRHCSGSSQATLRQCFGVARPGTLPAAGSCGLQSASPGHPVSIQASSRSRNTKDKGARA